MNPDVLRYLDALPEERKPLFAKLQELILEQYPKAEVVIWYGMPTFPAADIKKVVRHAIEHFDDHLK